MREGDRFDSYILNEKIAEGGMAEIFRAERVGAMNISREVCVKCIRPSLCTDAEFVRMFIDEARISATLRHSNIVSIDHFGSHEGALFSVMEWVHGTDASKVLKRIKAQGRLIPVDVALFIVAEVLKALEYAHGKTDSGQWLQIVHRDVTPHNVMVSYSGEVKLTDFGIAKATSRLHHTMGDVVKGKVSYMAPEQAMGLALDHRTDLFAVGVVAFELLTGRKPFAGATQVEGVHAMLRGEHPPLRSLRPEVSLDIEVFLEGLLATKADDRFADAGHALDAVQHVPELATGQRALQRLMRELYADVQHSTVLPRFAAPAVEAPSDATVPSSAASLLGVAVTSSGPTTPRAQPQPSAPTQRTEPLAPLDRTLTADRGAFDDAAPSGEHTLGARAVPAPAPVSPLPPRSRAPLIVGAVALATLGALVAVAVTRTGAGPAVSAPDAGVAVAPHDASAAAPDVVRAPAVDAAAIVDASVAVVVVDAGAAPAERVRMARLEVAIDPWGTVTVNGQRRDSPATFTLMPGTYRVGAQWNGVRGSRSVTLSAGESRHVVIRLRDR